MSEEEKSLEALRAELELQKAELKKLRDQLNPPPRQPSRGPIDYTEGMVMPRSAMLEMIKAVPESLMRDLRADARKPNPVTGGPNPQPQPQVRRGSGWRDEIPLSSPPGVALADKLMDAQDEIDRAELALKLAKVELSKSK